MKKLKIGTVKEGESFKIALDIINPEMHRNCVRTTLNLEETKELIEYLQNEVRKVENNSFMP